MRLEGKTAIVTGAGSGIGNPADIAAGFAYLASDEARWVTGIALTIDGGVSCGLVPE